MVVVYSCSCIVYHGWFCHFSHFIGTSMVVLQPTAMDWLGTKNKPVHILVPNLLKFRVMVTLFIVCLPSLKLTAKTTELILGR